MVMNCCGGVPICTGLKGFGPAGVGQGGALYPRTIDLLRSKDPAAQSESVGLGVYEGRTHSLAFSDPNGLALLVAGITCNIDAHGIGRSTGAMLLPGDVTKHPQWKISTSPLPLRKIGRAHV